MRFRGCVEKTSTGDSALEQQKRASRGCFSDAVLHKESLEMLRLSDRWVWHLGVISWSHLFTDKEG